MKTQATESEKHGLWSGNREGWLNLPKCSRALLQPERQREDLLKPSRNGGSPEGRAKPRGGAYHLRWQRLFSTLGEKKQGVSFCHWTYGAGNTLAWKLQKHGRLTQFTPELLWRIKTVGRIRTRTITRSLCFCPSHPHSHNRLEAAASWDFPHNDACNRGLAPCCGLGVPRDMTDDPQIPMWVKPYLQDNKYYICRWQCKWSMWRCYWIR